MLHQSPILITVFATSAVLWTKREPLSAIDDADHEFQMPSLKLLALFLGPGLTVVLSYVVSYLCHYALLNVAMILATVEAPGANFRKHSIHYQRDFPNADEEARNPNGGSFISSNFQSLRHHLYHEAGDLSLFRGIGLDIVIALFQATSYEILSSALEVPLQAFRIPGLDSTAAFIITTLISVQLDTAWTHIVISMPRQVFWFRRLPLTFWTNLKIFWLPALAHQAAYEAEGFAGIFLTSKRVTNMFAENGPLWWCMFALFRGAVDLMLAVTIALPMDIVVDRIRASCLPQKDDPIVPMDRSFGTSSKSTSGQDTLPITMTQAWQSMDRNTWIRLAKLYLKYMLIKEGVTLGLKVLITVQVGGLFGRKAIYFLIREAVGMPLKRNEVCETVGVLRTVLSTAFAEANREHNMTSVCDSFGKVG